MTTHSVGGIRLDDLLVEGVTRSGDDIVLSGSGLDMSGLEMLAVARQVAEELRAARIAAGEAVLLPVSNHPRDVACQLGAWLAGCVPVPVHRAFPAAVAADVSRRSGARVAVGVTPESWSATVDTDAKSAVHPVRAPGAPAPAELDRDQALVIFTSGSEGIPKGVVISHRAFATKLAAIDRVLRFRPDERMLQVLHLHFSFGQWTTLLTLASGGRVDLVERFSAKDVLDRLAATAYDRIAVVPTMMRMLGSALAEPGGDELLRRLSDSGSPRLWIAGGEPLPAGLGRGFREMLPASGIADVFGLSESATSDCILRPDEYDDHSGTIGRPSPGVSVKVMQESVTGFEEVASGSSGELWISTPYLMTGYLGDPAATAAAIVDGWLRTGDLARIGEGGFVELVGRAKTLIVRGGTKISPLEVEHLFTA